MRSALFGAMLAILAVHTLPAVAQAQPKDKAGAKAEPPPISKDEAAAVGFTVLGLGGIALIVAAMVAFCSYFAPTMIAPCFMRWLRQPESCLAAQLRSARQGHAPQASGQSIREKA